MKLGAGKPDRAFGADRSVLGATARESAHRQHPRVGRVDVIARGGPLLPPVVCEQSLEQVTEGDGRKRAV